MAPSILSIKHRPYDVVGQLRRQMTAQIQAEEDRRVFDALDEAANTCSNRAHAAHGRHVRECEEPECVAAWVHGS